MTLDPQSCRALAVEMVSAAVNDLKRHHRPRDIAFFEDASKSEMWCVGAGLDYDATISRLRRDGHLVAAPPAPRPAPRQPVRTPTRDAAYQREFRRRLLARLPRSSETACTTAALAQSLGVYRKAVQNALAPLRLAGRAMCRFEARRGGTTALWWKISGEISRIAIDTRTTP